MNIELMEALTILEKEKNISKDVMMDAIENSLISACKNHFGTSDNIKVIMDRDTCDYAVYAEKNVEGTFHVVRQLLENVESIGDFSGSKLYRHLQLKKNARWNADELREKLLEGFRDETEFSYMKGYEPWEKLVSK